MTASRARRRVRRVLRREGKPVALEELSLSFADPESQDFRERLNAEGFRARRPARSTGSA